MATLDRYIDALLRTPGAEAMTFREGKSVRMSVHGTGRVVGRSTPNAEQIMTVLREVLPADFTEQVREARGEFRYNSPHGPVRIQIEPLSGKLAARILPERPRGEPAKSATPMASPRMDSATAGDRPRRAAAGKPKEMMELFHHMLDLDASDLHIKSGRPPHVRIHGDMMVLQSCPSLSKEEVWELIEPIMPERNRAQFEDRKDTDFAYQVPGRARMRCNVFEDIGGAGAVFRQIPSEIMSIDQLGLPPVALELCEQPKGLVLVTGPTGSGKSTTLAAMIDHINGQRPDHVITIEDPVEFVHTDRKCLINQREVGTNTRSFKNALRAALREDPDVVLLGELRDLETTAIAIETAETGHLVFGTLHTNSAATTVDRIINQYSGDEQAQIRTMLAESLIGVVTQTLCKRIGGGRIAAYEILVVTHAISNLIREEKTFQIASMMQTSRGLGMQTMNDALLELVRTRQVEPARAYGASPSKREMGVALARAGFHGTWSQEEA